ncbi:MAG: TetR/AcrR family transcriptional regulator [Acetatifactor sp.]|nr:TetR/AcrR family transcriptional regulator [Acetatifactor sp.]
MKVTRQTNQKSEFTRMCIGEAVIALLKQTPFEKLKVSDIVKKAGVSRTTFYLYYDSPYAVLTDYLNILVAHYMPEGDDFKQTQFFTYEHILYSLQYFDAYRDFFLTLAEHKLHSVMLDGVNQFMFRYISTTRRLSVYMLTSYAGGLLNTFLKWEQDGRKDSAEEIARTIFEMYGQDDKK